MCVKTIKAPIVDIDITAYRGDTFNRLIFTVADIDDEGVQTPATLTDHQFAFEIREHPEEEDIVASFSDQSYFYLGRTEEAIQFDIDNDNPPFTTQDEFYIDIPAEKMKFPAGRYFYDLEVRRPNGEIYTPIRGRFILEQDITRNIQYDE